MEETVIQVEEVPKKKLSWREQQDLIKAQQQQPQQGDESLQEKQPPKLTYRQQQELLKAQQREQQQEQAGNDAQEQPPAKDVATLIRERIAANKQGSPARLPTPSPSSAGCDGGGSSGGWRGNSKKTAIVAQSPVASSSPVAVGRVSVTVDTVEEMERQHRTPIVH